MAYEIGATLKKYRNEAKMSVKQISDILRNKGFKASEKTIYSWENGNSQPTPDALLVMCNAYGIKDVLAAFGYNGYNDDGSLLLSLEEIKFIEKYRSLDDFGQLRVNTVLQWEINHKNHLDADQKQIHSLEKRLMAYVDGLHSLNAAHERPDATEEEKAISDAVMEDDNEWK